MKTVRPIVLAVAASLLFSLNTAYAKSAKETGVRAEESFVETCPEKFLAYLDKNEGGPGAYCDCPEENICYLDKSEGGPGFYCADKPE